MRKETAIKRAARALTAAILVILMAGCGATGDIPITTSSEEARELLLEGLHTQENLRRDEARELYSQALNKDPEFALAHMYRAWVSTSAKDRQDHITRAMALAPKASKGERLMIEANHAIWSENNPDKALDLRKRLVRRHPNDKRAHWVLGFSYGGRDQFDKAIAEYEKAIDIDQDYAPAYNSLGYAYILKGEYDRAEEAFQDYIRLIPEEANPYDSMADLYTRMGRHDEAIEHYQKAVELNPNSPSLSARSVST